MAYFVYRLKKRVTLGAEGWGPLPNSNRGRGSAKIIKATPSTCQAFRRPCYHLCRSRESTDDRRGGGQDAGEICELSRRRVRRERHPKHNLREELDDEDDVHL